MGREEGGAGAGKKGLRGKFQGVCRGGGRILMSQRSGLSVTSLLPEKRRPGQEAAQSAAAGVEGRSPGRRRRAGRGAELRAGRVARGWDGEGRPRAGQESSGQRSRPLLSSSSTLTAASSRLGPRRRAARVPPAGGAAEAPWEHCWGSGVEPRPRADRGWEAREPRKGPGGAVGEARDGREGPPEPPLALRPCAPTEVAGESGDPTCCASAAAWGWLLRAS